MSDLSTVADVVITAATQSVAVTGFGVPGIIAEFATSKTNVAFTRARYYSTTAAMLTDGWASTDSVYLAAVKLKTQNPACSQFMVGRIDVSDSTVADALTAISLEQTNWYVFGIVGITSALLTLSADVVTGSSIAYSVNGLARTPVAFASTHAGTMSAWETAIETALGAGTVATVSGRTMNILLPGTDISSFTAVVTGGATNPTATTVTSLIEADVLSAAAWAETEMKIYGVSDTDLATEEAGGLGYQLEALGYDRTYVQYCVDPSYYAQFAWMGKCLPFDPGSQTWAYKTLVGVAADGLTFGKQTSLLAGNVNIYTTMAGVSVTRDGKVISGEYIDIVRGIDWITARIQEAVFSLMVNAGKIPYDDEGAQMTAGAVMGVLKEAEDMGILVTGTAAVTVPLVSTVSTADKIGRMLPDINFTGLLEGAIQHTKINGALSL